MAAYVIGEVDVMDPAAYEDYRKQVGAVITKYGGRFIAAVRRERVAGVQFHPEKSSVAGLRLLRNFVEIA